LPDPAGPDATAVPYFFVLNTKSPSWQTS